MVTPTGGAIRGPDCLNLLRIIGQELEYKSLSIITGIYALLIQLGGTGQSYPFRSLGVAVQFVDLLVLIYTNKKILQKSPSLSSGGCPQFRKSD